MMFDSQQEDLTTQLLKRVAERQEGAEQELYARVYAVLRELARREMGRQREDHTLQPTALVNEAWLRMSGGRELRASDRQHFLALAARAMRCALVDHARGRSRAKRGAGWSRRVLDEALEQCAAQSIDVLALDEALERLRQQDERLARLVELRFFAGLDTQETAELLGHSPARVERDWRLARVFLRSALDPGEAS